MKVYHGSTTIVEKPLVSVGRKTLDFGQGFYVTEIKEQAISWARRPSNEGKPQVLNVYELDINGILAHNYKYKRFDAYDSEWLEFVVANRRGKQRWKEYDIIEGGIANDRVFNTIELYIAGLTPMDEALKRLKHEHPNNQICILRQEIIDQFLHFSDAKQI
ncbi:MAG: DUF3990 domain-containing protein [Bacteroidales bacterium]|nr:DUF3990 domain-containing protein [Bacteroidales bacterium]